MNALASEKFILKAIKRCVKNVFFLKYCMGFKVEMMVTLAQPGLISLNFVHHPSLENVARECDFIYRKQGKFFVFP